MQIGILRTGRVNARIAPRFGEYPGMAEALLRTAGKAFRFAHWHAVDGELPADPKACDGWLVTGSPHGVYEGLPWIEQAARFLRRSVDADRPVLGICFGHQLLAKALGGEVVKSDRGWGIGVQQYRVRQRPAWMPDAPDLVAFQTVHQDQVVTDPPDALRIAGSEFCPSGMLSYGSSGFSIQAHPEFSPAFARALLLALRGDPIDEAECDRALATVDRPTDERRFAEWATNFFLRKGLA